MDPQNTDKPTAFQPQQDGSFLPSPELMERIRNDPNNYPDAAKDFSVLSGGSHTPEQVQDIIDNPAGAGGIMDHAISGADELVIDAAQGALEGVATASDKLFGAGGETLRAAANWLDPKFDNEKGVVETIAEVGGQAIPAIAATVATGGVAASVLAGAGVATLTFDDKDNLANALQEIAPGITPDILVVTDEDSQEIATLKHLATNILTDAAFVGLGSVAGKLIGKLSKGVTPEEAAVLVREAAAELPAPAVAKVEEAVAEVAPTVATKATPKEAEALKVTTEELDKVLKSGADATVQTRVRELINGKPPAAAAVPEEFLNGVLAKVGKVQRLFEERVTNTTALGKLSDEMRSRYANHATQVAAALHAGDSQLVVKLLKTLAKLPKNATPQEVNSLFLYNQSLTKVAYEHMENNFAAVIKQIRDNPDATTRASLSAVTKDYLAEVGEIGDLYRAQGTAASHGLLLRKGFGTPDAADDFLKASSEVDIDLKEAGIGLFDGKGTFAAKKIIALDDAGIDATGYLDEIYKMFDDFDASSAGRRAGLRKMKKLTPAEKLGVVGKFVQTVKDIQGMMLLGQFMTTTTEVLSTGTQTLLLPALRAIGGHSGGRVLREYAGMMNSTALARGTFWNSFKAGKDKVDDFYLKEGSFSRSLDHERLLTEGRSGVIKSLLLRTVSLAIDLSQASTAFFKTQRAYGIAYADGLEAALAAGSGKVEASNAAKTYAASRFNAEGALIDEDLRTLAAQAPFQMAFDGSTMTGKLGQFVENIRNSEVGGGTLGLAARGVLPFFRTLTNIGNRGAQMILPPGASFALRKLAPNGTGVARFLDDFTGKNGRNAMDVAKGYNRTGAVLTMGAFGLTQLDGIEITGPSRGTRWDAKKQSYELMPASSIIIGNEALDLSRMLPFSAPLMLAGVLRDYQLQDAIRMEGGNYDSTDTATEYLAGYMQAWMVSTATLLQDAGAARGVFDLIDAVSAAVAENDASGLKKYVQNYITQFTPGPLRMGLKAGGGTQYEAYDFLERWGAQAGMALGVERLDIFGYPVEYPVGKGIDPSNRRVLKLDDPAYAEAALLNRMEGMAILAGSPRDVFDKAFWKKLGVNTDSLMNLGSGNAPDLAKLKTRNGKNAWETYREVLLKGKVTAAAIKKATSSYGDRIDVGKVVVKPGENFETAIRRIIQLPEYQEMTLDARVKVWKATQGVFKKAAKDYLEQNVVVDPTIFEGSRYGSPISAPSTVADTEKAGKALASKAQRTSGSRLDAAFAITE